MYTYTMFYCSLGSAAVGRGKNAFPVTRFRAGSGFALKVLPGGYGAARGSEPADPRVKRFEKEKNDRTRFKAAVLRPCSPRPYYNDRTHTRRSRTGGWTYCSRYSTI